MNESDSPSVLKKDSDEIDFIDSIVFLWQTRLFIFYGLALGAALAAFIALIPSSDNEELAKAEIILVPGENELGAILAPQDGLQAYLFSSQGSSEFLKSIKEDLAELNPELAKKFSEQSSLKSFVSAVDFDDQKNLRIFITLQPTILSPVIEKAIVSGLNKAINKRNEKIRANLLEVEDRLFLTTQTYSKISVNLLRMAWKNTNSNDALAAQILREAVVGGSSVESIDRMYMVISIVPDGITGKQMLLNEFRQASREMINAKGAVENIHNKLELSSAFASWKSFEMKDSYLIDNAKLKSKNGKIIKSIVVGIGVGGVVGGVLGSAVFYWRSNRKRIRAIFESRVSVNATSSSG